MYYSGVKQQAENDLTPIPMNGTNNISFEDILPDVVIDSSYEMDKGITTTFAREE